MLIDDPKKAKIKEFVSFENLHPIGVKRIKRWKPSVRKRRKEND